MSKNFDGLSCVHLELSSLCNKECWMCGRRKVDRDYPEIAMNYGHMDFDLLKRIAQQVPENIVIQFHNNGEPFLYPDLRAALDLFPNNIRCLNTNAKLLVDRADDVIDRLDSLTISVIENDPEADEQFKEVEKFLRIKGKRKPMMVYRLLGNVKDAQRWHELPGIVATRVLHHPMGSFQYEKKPTVPEIGMCIEILTHMAINRLGNVSVCVRFDPEGLGVLGNANETPLLEIWNGHKRKQWIDYHRQGRRDLIPFCAKCDFWGVPTGST